MKDSSATFPPPVVPMACSTNSSANASALFHSVQTRMVIVRPPPIIAVAIPGNSVLRV
eukprot:CAMPEP_0201657172 /NCGR_PEP_ID=MMETSP0494-20130426/497_1 /ASSEMBLY_ACC=CAM_ASM_000839 /TAXON_ID=420259 /ORGANISM="Thalassiosira gravida, Strain GMp14c1" /LENGTH=57 /DNA_ID=CAMNT_0048133949 /DNA_START=231 /DNA_END=404 /DNA_ORIENTATION=+